MSPMQETFRCGGGDAGPNASVCRPLGRAGGIPTAVGDRSGAGVLLGRVGGRVDLEPGRAEVLVNGLLPVARGDHLGDGSVDLLAGGGVALLEADAVALRRERLADDLELALVLRLRGVAGQD